MEQTFKVLIVEDQPIIIESYKNILLQISSFRQELKFNIDSAVNCDDAILQLNMSKTNGFYDIIFLDIRLPPSTNGKILCGEDIGLFIRKNIEETKIIIITMYDDNYRLNNILRTVKPEGLIFKNDLTSQMFMNATETVLSDAPFYSPTILKLVKKQISSDLVIDYIDRQILFLVANGKKMKELPDYIPLSIGAIERRKRILKAKFNANSNDDVALINSAREMGFI